jgi:hypothetical protein
VKPYEFSFLVRPFGGGLEGLDGLSGGWKGSTGIAQSPVELLTDPHNKTRFLDP